MKKKLFHKGIPSLILFALSFLLLQNCHTPPDPKYTKDGTPYGVVKGLFRERWWNFYERGASYSAGEFWEQAIADFKEAISQRDHDQRRARTYGMHFVDYFPHRDLGAAYYHIGEYEEAVKELEYSFSSVDTAKTKYYLNMVRKALLKVSDADTAPPDINVTSLAAGEVTNRFKMKLEGEVSDDSYAETIVINDDPLFIELADKKIPFSQEVKLKKGINRIKIQTSDLLGKTTEKEIEVFGDFEGPLVNVSNFIDGQEVGENKVVLAGTLADATGITTFKINDQVFAYNKEREVEFTFALNLDKGTNKVAFAATDIAGNTTRGEMKLLYVPSLAQEKATPPAVYACQRREPIRLALQGSGILDTGQHRLFAAAEPAPMAQHFRLDLKDLADTQTVYFDTIYVDGSVIGISNIKTVTINGSPLFIIPGKTIYFNQLLELDEGENQLTIEVEDAEGNKTSKAVTIVREVPKVHQIGSRLTMTILPFETKGELTSASTVIYDNLVNAFFDQGRFNVVARGTELEAVLKELNLSETDLVDRTKAVKVGKLAAAEGILMGSIRETKDSIEIYARFVNTETSTILEAKDVYGQDKSLSQLQYLTNGLALKFKHSFPLIEGMVVKTKGNDIYADFGSVQKIKQEMKFIVFREGEAIVHPVTGKVLGSDSEELGVATVVQVFEDMSLGKLLADFDATKIKEQDLIVTK